MAADRTPYHRWCVKCFNCRVSLNPRTLNEHNEQLFCNLCYQNIFNPQEFSMYGYNGNITEEDRLRYVVETRRTLFRDGDPVHTLVALSLEVTDKCW